MKFLSICDPTLYKQPPLDVPTFYQHMSRDPRIEFHHIPVANVFAAANTLPTVSVAPASGELSYEAFVKLGDRASSSTSLSDIDLVFCRTLKPFPPGYLDQLSSWEQWTRFVNRPSSKVEQIKPDFLLKVARECIPDALITADEEEAQAFFETHRTVVAKQDNSCGGRGVYKISYSDRHFQVDNVLAGLRTFESFAEVMAYLQQHTTAALQIYRYLNRVDAGDK